MLFRSCSYEGGTNGANLSQVANSYVAVAGELLGWRAVYASGIGGTGYTVANGAAANLPINRIPVEVNGKGLDGLVLGFFAQNDPDGQPAALTAAVTAAVNAARTGNPGMMIWVLGIGPTPLNTLAAAQARENAIASGVAAAGGGSVNAGAVTQGADPFLYFVAFSTASDGGVINAAAATNGANSVFQNNNVHPNDWGHKKLGWYVARQIAATIQSLV